jgi:TolB-like protein/DNA-binding winged helix-turn-helix (wHTH) protein
MRMSETLEVISFGPFRLDTERRRVDRNGIPVVLSSRAFDILVLLVENRGRVVGKDEIMTRVWRGMIVEENNLAVQISALRRALAERAGDTPLIVTVPGQGYRFVGRLNQTDDMSRDVPAPTAAEREPPLPVWPGAAIHARRPRWRIAVIAACVAALVLGGVTAALLQPRLAEQRAVPLSPPPRLSLAVLPFRDLSDDRCCDYLADAITDDLTTDLSLIPGSIVIARESADMFRGHPAPADAIGRALNVRYLLEGSLRAVDGQFSINAQLIEAASGAHLWAERFTVPRAHLAGAQDAIVQRLSSALGVKLVDIEGARPLREHGQDPDALDLFWRARSILDRADTLDAMNQAQALLEQALARQPDDVNALSELGWLLPRKINNYITPHREQDLARARVVTARAMALQPRDPAVLAAKAALQAYDGDCKAAQLTYQAALDGDAHSVRALTGQTMCKFQLDRFADAVASLGALLRIDPDGPGQKSRFYQMGFAELMLDHPAEALPWLRRAIAGEPDPLPGAASLTPAEWARLSLIAATRLAGDRATSDTYFAAYRRIWPDQSTWALESRAPRLFSTVPGFRHFLAALEDAGLPRFADPRRGPATGTCDSADVSPTPHDVPGITTIDTAGLAALLRSGRVRVVDFGVGAAVPDSAQLSDLDPGSATDMATLRQTGRPVVAMGSGALDPRGCQAARLLAGLGQPVFWYRGGEEAWAQAGMPARDLR